MKYCRPAKLLLGQRLVLTAVLGVFANLLVVYADTLPSGLWVGNTNDVASLEKSLGKHITVRGWLTNDKEGPMIILDDRTHDGISIEAIRVHKAAEVTLRITWTGWMSFKEEYSIVSSQEDSRRLRAKIETLEKTYKLYSKPSCYVAASGQLYHKRILIDGMKHHRRCAMPQDHFFFSVDDVRILPTKLPREKGSKSQIL